ncbi:hypothetical protein L6452_01130 [Arctium lappa]|uniref:Uncharacterized protein n=1 Tax=Arctium lappa TaxID=4217 RepID=A0ACB9FGM8_ARCLA|nr:hypothetical protein L6452_01130 [Arctium lappa]
MVKYDSTMHASLTFRLKLSIGKFWMPSKKFKILSKVLSQNAIRVPISLRDSRSYFCSKQLHNSNQKITS